MKFKLKNLSVSLPFGLGGANIELTEGQARAAWMLYVEIATRVASQELKKGEGSVREGLNSIHSLFETTRMVLRQAGPDAAEGPNSIGPLAIRILNNGVRPNIVKWHTSLGAFEHEETLRLQKDLGANAKITIDESKWNDYDNFYDTELPEFQKNMKSYLKLLEESAGISGNLDLD